MPMNRALTEHAAGRDSGRHSDPVPMVMDPRILAMRDAEIQ